AVKFHSHVKVPILDFVKSTLASPFVASLTLCVLIWAVNAVAFGSLSYSGRGPYLVILACEGTAFLLAYTFIMLKSRYFDDVDRELFTNNYLLAKVQRMFGRTT